MTFTTEREFVLYRRGEGRDLILAFFREALRNLLDPDTGEPFTEDTIRLVTQFGSRFYAQADADDLLLMGGGKRAEFTTQQLRVDRAGSSWLRNYHATEWGEAFLPGFGGVGIVRAIGTAGTTWVGSTTIPDSAAAIAIDPAGNRYQVLISGTADADGNADLSLGGIDTGTETNVPVDTELRWSTPPSGSDPTATVTLAFEGGAPAETDADFAERLSARIRHKPAAGNAAQFRAWARQSNVSVDDAFVYPTAFEAGSVLVVPLQKRGAVGPTARIPGAGVITAVTEFLVPPASPVVPPQVDVRVVAPRARTTDIVLLLSLLKGSSVGWADAEPFPESRGALAAVAITTLTTQTHFRITAGSAGQLPGGVAGPITGVSLMLWTAATSSFEALHVNTITDLGSGVYDVTLSSVASRTLVLGDVVSPLTARSAAIEQGVVEYFDSLGPGEVVDLATDTRSSTAFRRPPPSEEAPSRAGQSVITFVSDALGSALADATLDRISVTTPSVPTDPIDGPELIVLGSLAVYPLD